MAEIKNTNGEPAIEYMARDYDSLLQSMRERIPYKLPEWKEYQSETDFGNVLLQLFAHMGDILSYYQDRVANESFLSTAKTRRSVIDHLKLIGYKLATAAPASATLKLTVPETFTDTITIRKGDAFGTKSQKNNPSIRFEYTRETDLVIDCSTLPVDSSTHKRYFGGTKDEEGNLEGIPVEEGRLIRDEKLGESDGTPNQTFPLAHSGLILRSLGTSQQITKDIILISTLGGTNEEWKLLDGLAFSGEEKKDFVIEIDDQDRATIIFGDGSFGAIPPVGTIFGVTYRVGGGSSGNVAAETIQTIIDAPQLALAGAKVTNPESATGGSDHEETGHAVMHAPDVFRSLKRAVTGADYEALALDFKGVGKVRAERANWNTVNLYVAPEGGGGQVSDTLHANLIAYFEDKRPLSTIIEIQNVEYVSIYVTAEVGIVRYYAEEDVAEKVQEAARTLLDFNSVDFGQTIYLSKFYEAIEAIEGVDYVTIKEFSRDIRTPAFIEPEGKIELGDHEIPIVPAETDYASGLKVVIDEESL